MQRRGYTLIELAAVLAVMAIAAGAVAWTLGDARSAATLDEAIDRIRMTDHLARTAARRLGRTVTLRFDADANTIRRLGHTGQGNAAGHATTLPGGFRLARVQSTRDASATRGLRDAEVAISPMGISPTYAVELVHPAAKNRSRAWIVIAGASGQVTRLDDEAAFKQLLASLGARDE